MERILNWIKSRTDHNIVSYSRFGLPGDELDDRPPPSVIHVAVFHDDSPEFMAFGTHSQRAAVQVSAGIGLSIVIFVFLSVFFEFDWYHHEKGVDIGALIGLVLFLILGVSVHWQVVRGIKSGQPSLLVAFITIYAIILVIEAVFFIFVINHWVALSYLRTFQQSEPTKIQHPGIRVVFGAGEAVMHGSTIGVAAESVGEPVISATDAPPSYSHTDRPQRTIFQAEDGI
uniref:DUF4203 domain-containing protein n=1 Tax=Heterorhabditis bacteriophora TaxID=37862 RepID=A0A1I7X1Y5_HETBA